jgi:hypothetical protein
MDAGANGTLVDDRQSLGGPAPILMGELVVKDRGEPVKIERVTTLDVGQGPKPLNAADAELQRMYYADRDRRNREVTTGAPLRLCPTCWRPDCESVVQPVVEGTVPA